MIDLMVAAATAARCTTVLVLCVSFRCAVGLQGACFHRQRGKLVPYFVKANTAVAKLACLSHVSNLQQYVSLLRGLVLLRSCRTGACRRNACSQLPQTLDSSIQS